VHVRISNCPQNTAANIYIVKHNDYNYTDGAAVSTLSSHYPLGFNQPHPIETDSQGEWSGHLWTTAEEGEFDIIVDLGSPSTPDGLIRFSFSGANVMDGFDGRYEPGFRVTNNNIDLVVALDISASMTAYETKLKEYAQSLVGTLIHRDKINIFKFNEGTEPNWTLTGCYNYLGTGGGFYFSDVTPLDQYSMMTALQPIVAEGNTDLFIPFYRSMVPFSQSPLISTRRRAFLLLSDGEHHVSPGNSFHEVVPYVRDYLMNSMNGISCYTMRYSNITEGITNMNNIALWGNGTAYYVNQFTETQLILNRLLNEIRGLIPNCIPVLVRLEV
jgi:hypothetical protein